MKRVLTVFPRQTFVTPDGAKKVYTHDLALCSLLGQGKEIRVQPLGQRASANAKVTLQAWESSSPGQRPSEVGKVLGAPLVLGQPLRPNPVNLNGTFGGMVELVLTIEHDAGGATQQEYDLEVAVTLILD